MAREPRCALAGAGLVRPGPDKSGQVKEDDLRLIYFVLNNERNSNAHFYYGMILRDSEEPHIGALRHPED